MRDHLGTTNYWRQLLSDVCAICEAKAKNLIF